MRYPGTGPGSPTVKVFFATLGNYAAVVFSAFTLGLSASIVAHDHHSIIGIAHLTVSTFSLVVGLFSCFCKADPTLIFMFFNLLMYVGVVVPLAVDPVAHRDIHAGHSDNSSTVITDHPYYGLFVLDLIYICQTAFGFIIFAI
ncbi:hypothetical protein C8F04DRAFT_277019 [Mycena alexandri]|uniref:Uncharacterized protein n=2 Tax=Mycena alexandri TaxID=1745969 RepID=A0AAD6S5L8_9AGAR|nr:hypothetical protein C8F04DRAFT_277019 [Mycena alexandri]